MYYQSNIIFYNKKTLIYFFIKRLADLLISFITIIFLFPFLILISILIKLTSKGPILFKDKRVGLDKKVIVIYKFRTMYVDSETNITKYLSKDELEAWKKERKLNNDPRVTKIGRFLRKSSMDELPQLFNVLVGDLSLVGPRPITLYELEENYTHNQQLTFIQAKPGITGIWQVYGRGFYEYKNEKRQILELQYFKKRSVFFDLKLFLLTFIVIIQQKGAK